MRLGLGWVLGAALGLCAAQGCGSNEDNDQRACVPGASQSCAGPQDCDGYQVCNDEGSAFEPCMCGDGGNGGSGGSSADGGGGGSGGTSDSGGSAGASDGGSSGGTNDAGGSSATSDSGAGGTTSSGGTSTGGTAGSGNATSATSSGGSSTSSGGSGADGGTSTTGGGTGGTGTDCSVAPTVMLVVDASSSMWDNGFWEPLREAVLGAVEELDGDVRFGLATFTGVVADTCPLDLNTVDVGLNRYDEIADFYQALAEPAVSTETPTAAALYWASDTLQNNADNGRKAILLVTDGNPDYCDNGELECRADTTVRVLQDAAEAGIETLVAALPDPTIDQAWLTAMANAGRGEPVSAPRPTAHCADIPTATADLLQGIDPDTFPMGSYGNTMGPREAFALSDTDDIEGMTSVLVDAITDWASCARPRQNRIESRY